MTVYKDLYINQGSSFSEVVTVEDNNNGTINIFNYDIKSQVKKSYYSSTSYDFDIIMVDSTSFKLYMNANNTSSLSPGRYVYDVILDDGCDNVQRIMEGIVIVTPGVTKCT